MIYLTSMVLLVIDFTIYTALIDAEHINKDEYITNHFDRWLQRACFFIAFAFTHIVYSLAAALLFTALFDQILNIARGKHLLYLGTVSKWDRFFQHKIYLYVTVKILSLLTSIFLFLL